MKAYILLLYAYAVCYRFLEKTEHTLSAIKNFLYFFIIILWNGRDKVGS